MVSSLDKEADKHVRTILKQALTEMVAHVPYDKVFANFPMDKLNEIPPNSPHSFWEVLEHIRISFLDLVDYLLDENYKEMKWPDEFWPKTKQTDEEKYNQSVEQITELYTEILEVLGNPNMNLYAEIPLRKGTNHTPFRDIILIIAHNSFHLGQFVQMRKQLGIW